MTGLQPSLSCSLLPYVHPCGAGLCDSGPSGPGVAAAVPGHVRLGEIRPASIRPGKAPAHRCVICLTYYHDIFSLIIVSMQPRKQPHAY